MAVAKKRWVREAVNYFLVTLPFAFSPIGFIWLLRRFQGGSFSWSVLAADGGILTIAACLNADAASRLVWSNPKWAGLKAVLAAFTTLAIASGSALYGLRYVRGMINWVVFADLSLLVFIVSLILATFCRFLPEDNS